MSNLSDISVVILAGGLGIRLRSVVPNLPKVLAEIHNRPFLEILLDQLHSSKFKNVIICAGYSGNQIKKTFGKRYKGLNLSYSEEQKQLLGTGGALRLALPLIKSNTFLVMNGDSFIDINFDDYLKFHIKKNANISLALWHALKTDRFGKVKLDTNDRILKFEEKKSNDPGFINAGVYLLNQSLLSEIPKGVNLSLESNIFPKLIQKNLYGYRCKGRFIDIGTPESYMQAQHFFVKKTKKEKRFVLLDRDGTIIVERNYLSDPKVVELLPGVTQALRQLKKMGLGLLVITNQSGLGRGYFNLKTLQKIHHRMIDLLAKENIALDDIYFCPHVPEDNCSCRKPNIGLVEKAMQKHKFNPKLGFVIGDNKSDIELGKKIGSTTILVKTGYGKEISEKRLANPDYVTDNLSTSVKIIKRLIKIV